MSDLTRIDPRLKLERLRNRDWQNRLRSIFRELDTAAEQLESALIHARQEAFEGRFTPDYLRERS